MKASRTILLAVLLIAFAASSMAVAQDHPKKSEHPKKTEHPKKEHPAKSEHPGKSDDIVGMAAAAGEFTTFAKVIEAAGLVETLRGKGPFTVFAPTDKAFAKLPAGTLEDLLQPANKAKLAGILANHVVPGKIMAADLKTMKATNVNGLDLDIEVTDDLVTVGHAKVVKADILTANGIIHAIDTVIVQDVPAKTPGTEAPKDHPAH